MKDLRPISLCNVLFKIVSKVLANRLKRILPRLISSAQSVFVHGRSIQDNVVLTFEVIHYMKRKTRGKVGNVALKIYISKAYDRVDWSYLRKILIQLGLDPNWMSLVMWFVSTAKFSICLNGDLVGPINPERGLR